MIVYSDHSLVVSLLLGEEVWHPFVILSYQPHSSQQWKRQERNFVKTATSTSELSACFSNSFMLFLIYTDATFFIRKPLKKLYFIYTWVYTCNMYLGTAPILPLPNFLLLQFQEVYLQYWEITEVRRATSLAIHQKSKPPFGPKVHVMVDFDAIPPFFLSFLVFQLIKCHFRTKKLK